MRECIHAGMTLEKDTVILLNMSHALVQVCSSTKLRERLQKKRHSSREALSQLSAALEKRDPTAGEQIFFIENEDSSGIWMQAATIKIAGEYSHNTEVYTRKQWDEKEHKAL